MEKDKAIIFDMDGVLVDSEGLKAEAYRQAFLKFGITDGDKWYLKNYGKSGLILAKMAIIEFDIQNKNPEELHELIYEDIYKNLLKENPSKEIESSINFLKSIPRNKYKIAVASSEYHYIIKTNLDRIGLYDYFDAITSGVEEIGKGKEKPFPEIYLLTAEKLEVLPKNCIAIEDTPAGIEAVKSAGMFCIALKTENNKNSDLSKADLIVDDLTKLNINDIFNNFKKP